MPDETHDRPGRVHAEGYVRMQREDLCDDDGLALARGILSRAVLDACRMNEEPSGVSRHCAGREHARQWLLHDEWAALLFEACGYDVVAARKLLKKRWESNTKKGHVFRGIRLDVSMHYESMKRWRAQGDTWPIIAARLHASSSTVRDWYVRQSRRLERGAE